MAKILIVDDEPELRMIANMVLKREGHETNEVESGEACLEKLKKETYDLILLDVMMPGGINGWEVCKKIKSNKKTKDVKILMFTVCTDSDSMKRGIDAGADDQVSKPFGNEDLVEKVEKVLKG